jgi:hypothetical protein
MKVGASTTAPPSTGGAEETVLTGPVAVAKPFFAAHTAGNTNSKTSQT